MILLKSWSKFICSWWMSTFLPYFYKILLYFYLCYNKISLMYVSFYFHPAHKLLNYFNWEKFVSKYVHLGTRHAWLTLMMCFRMTTGILMVCYCNTSSDWDLAEAHMLVSWVHLWYTLILKRWFKNTVTGLWHK